MSHLIDTNLLVYAAVASSPHHQAARSWLESRFSDTTDTVELTWPILYSFMRLVTSRRIMGNEAVSLMEAWAASDAFRLQPNCRLVGPGPEHAAVAARLAETPGLASNDVPDVMLAAIAVEHGLELCTHDHGFARFQGLRWSNPLA